MTVYNDFKQGKSSTPGIPKLSSIQVLTELYVGDQVLIIGENDLFLMKLC